MVVLFGQKLVSSRVMGEDERPDDRVEDTTAVEKLVLPGAVTHWLTQHGTAQSLILLGTVEPRLQALFMENTDGRTLWERQATAYKIRLKLNVFQSLEELLGIRLQGCDNVEV
jgi:hypothetical protein